MELRTHPATLHALARVRAAGEAGVQASVLIEMFDRLLPAPPGFFFVRALIEGGYVTAATRPLTADSILVLTQAGEDALEDAAILGAVLDELPESTSPSALQDWSILAFLTAVERGQVVLTREVAPGAFAVGVIPYSASNGWRIGVAVNEHGWDGLEWVEAGGARIGCDAIGRTLPAVGTYHPQTQVAEDAYGLPRPASGKTVRASVRPRAFQQVLDALEQGRSFPLDARSSKMLLVLIGPSSADASITPDSFVVHFGKKKRRPDSYFRQLAPRVVSEIMARAGIQQIARPTLIGLPAGAVPATGYPAWSYEPRLLWIVPGTDGVRIVSRKSPEAWRTPYVQDVPTTGPLALPDELPAWTPAKPTFTDFTPPLACPSCEAVSARYRQLDEALVCASCGRSFRR